MVRDFLSAPSFNVVAVAICDDGALRNIAAADTLGSHPINIKGRRRQRVPADRRILTGVVLVHRHDTGRARLALSLSPSLALSLSPSLAHSLTRSLAHSFTRSATHSLHH